METKPAEKNYLTGSRVVHNKKCVVYKIFVTPDGTNASYADIYNGNNTTEPKVTRLRIRANETKEYNFDGYLELERGLYIDFGANLESVLVLSRAL